MKKSAGHIPGTNVFRCKHTGKKHVELAADASLPTRFGNFRIYAFCSTYDHKEHVALVKGDVRGKSGVPVRVHSECFTGDIMASKRCDCREQLEKSLHYLAKQKCGVLVYLRQEGRGIGLINKVRAYKLQEQGVDTYEANELLGFPYDARDYTVAAKILGLLGVKSIRILTNNPHKIEGLKRHGVKIAGRVEIETKPNKYNSKYLSAKQRKGKHMLHVA
jgi:GTP cyclohydrolase II